MKNPTCHLTVLALLAAPPALSQDVSVVLRAGDPLPGGAVRFVNDSSVASDGSWSAIVRADGPSSSSDDHVIRDGVPYLREGDPLPAGHGPAGTTWDSFLTIEHAAADELWITADLDGLGVGIGSGVVVRNSKVVVRELDPVVDPRLPAGSYWFDFRQVRSMGPRTALVGGYIEGPSLHTTALARITVDAAGSLLSQELVYVEGDTVPGYTQPLSFIGLGEHDLAANARGDILMYAFASGGTSTTGVLLNGEGVVLENTPSPVPGRNWRTVAGPEIDLNDHGSWVVRALLDGSFSDRDVLVVDDAVFKRQGDAVAAMGGAAIQDFGLSCGPYIGNSGSVLWYGDFAGSTADDEALFLDDGLLFRENTTTIAGSLVIEVSDSRGAFELSDDGAHAVAELDLDVAGVSTEVLVLVHLRPGSAYCEAAPNSTGGPAGIGAFGSSAVSDNDLELRAWGLPQNSFGFFLTSRDAAFVPMPGSSQGNLCLGGSVGRYSALAQSSGAAGELSLALDLVALSQPNGAVSAAAGETWHFQCWYRDANPATTSNFTNGVRVTFD